MKHRTTVVICLLVIVASSAVTVQAYQGYHAWRIEQDREATTRSRSEMRKSAIQQAIFNAEVKKLENQCSRDMAAYASLTPTAKAKTAAPQCDVNLVQ